MKTQGEKMILPITKLIADALAFKTQFNSIKDFSRQIFLGSALMKYATVNSFSVMNFESTKDQVDDEYVTVAQLSQRYPAFSQGSIRWLIFTGGPNNSFSKVIVRIGRKVVINLSKWKAFLEEQTG